MTRFAFRDDQGDGTDLRGLGFAGEQVAARLYFAVRDERWRTVPLEVQERQLRFDDDGFELRVRGRSGWASLPVELDLEYLAHGTRLTATFRGRATGALRFNRIGFCLLLPLELAGRPVTLHAEGREVRGRFPVEIAPQSYVDDLPTPLYDVSFHGLDTSLPSSTGLRVAFEGDRFEIEDQRNWSDASYKVYGTPLSLGFPFSADAGRVFAQTVRLEVDPAVRTDAPRSPDVVRVGERIGILPGLGLYSAGEPDDVWRPELAFPGLNRTRPARESLGPVRAVAVGINGSVHADDRWSIAETAFTHGRIAAQIHELYPELELRLRPLDFSSPAGNWMTPEGSYTHTPAPGSDHPLRHEPFAAAWLVASLGSLAGTAVVAVDVGEPALAATPLGELVAELAPRAGRPVRRVAAPAGIGALAIEDGDGVLLLLSNPDTVPRRVEVAGAGPVELAPDAVARVTVPGSGSGGSADPE